MFWPSSAALRAEDLQADPEFHEKLVGWKTLPNILLSQHSLQTRTNWTDTLIHVSLSFFFFHFFTGGYNVGPRSHVPFYAPHCGRRSLPPPPTSCSPSFSEVRYCISARLFLTVSNAHQIPQVGGLRGLISANALTFTKSLRKEITSKVTLELHLTCRPPLAGNLLVKETSNMLWIHPHLFHTRGKFGLTFSLFFTTREGGSSQRFSLDLGAGYLEIWAVRVTQTWQLWR